MPLTTEEIILDHGFPGTHRAVIVHRFGPASPDASAPRPKAYIQAALHADEIPGLLVAQHLLNRLKAADAEGRVRGDIILVPYANPIGLSQAVLGTAIGRFALSSGVNFNRDFPDLAAPVADRVLGRLGPDAAANVALVRRAALAAIAAWETATEADSLRKTLMGLAIDADLVLDLHCDSEALVHAYTGTEAWPDAADLMAELGCRAVFLALESGGNPFDEACSGLWWRLRNRLTAGLSGAVPPLPAACLAATIELRGRRDVDDALAATDADALARVLIRRGLLAGDAGATPVPACQATPLAGVDRVRAPVAGVVLYTVALGDTVSVGQTVAEVVDPVTGTRHAARARTSGVVWARAEQRYTAAGAIITSIAGDRPLAEEGSGLLTAR
ncbi:succinylglutamate desuccinylase/aspartoacylase family protein [Nitrospirillum sp. BR 11164]|uniref:succinylglutamate desuccinylase/aspartoacylase family protein n=1 Tax=Nitrospirillum sp. BR 11164 TaxID=3104324 RepID=UPI002AFEC0B8|nr:succinylglutamate desuccinylase/aspartoacylase family protein [Nitrospirillum sp. BR 11164]MEA1651407.1 succinylglutamate desuccinylase/aspartoacylase family protein [Nitrospirillum sp. BR 11164]